MSELQVLLAETLVLVTHPTDPYPSLLVLS